MLIRFEHPGYEKIEPFDIPDRNFTDLYRPKGLGLSEDEETRVLARGLREPHGAPPLRAQAKRGDRVVIIFDDGTRFTPIARLLPYVTAELFAAGVEARDLTLLTAPGTHRPMPDAELKAKLGEAFGRFRVVQHDWLDTSRLFDFGRTKDGTTVKANVLLRDADLVIGLGSIVPHRVKGFSGGAKIAFPGVAGQEIMERNQWEASMHMSETVMGVAENPMRLRMEEAARLAGVNYIVNLVLDRDRRIAGCFAGDVVQAHRAGCGLARAINAAHMPRRADIVIIDSYPQDRDFWQSAKAIYSGTLAVREGGTLIMVSPNPEGVANNHPNLLELGYRPHAELVKLARSGKVDDIIGLAILADVAQILDHADCIMVSPGVKPPEAEQLGFRHAKSSERALAMAFEKQGPNASVAVLQHGGHILPLAGPR